MADLIAPLPIIRLYGGMTIRLEAIDAAGNPAAGVVVTDVAIYGQSGGDSGTEIPLYTGYLLAQDV